MTDDFGRRRIGAVTPFTRVLYLGALMYLASMCLPALHASQDLLAFQVPATATATATIEGIIQKSGNTDPISAAGVELIRINVTDERFVGTAARNGRFSFKDIPPGEYRLTATHPGFVRAEYGQRGPNGHGLPITLTSGQQIKDVTIALVETGAISGRIFNRNGLPLENVQVQALKFTYKDGHRVLSAVRATVTNDLGDFRLFWLPPADYFIVATPLAAVAPNVIRQIEPYGAIGTSTAGSPTGRPIRLPNDEISAPFYFPGVTNPQSASAIKVGSAANIAGINITIRPMAARSVSGVVVNLPNAAAGDARGARAAQSAAAAARVRLEPRIPMRVENDGMLGEIDSSGAFLVRDVLPGSYDVVASSGNSHGHAIIEVTNANVEGVRIPMTEDKDVNVIVSIEGHAPNPTDPDIARLRIQLTPNSTGSARQQPTGAFVLHGMRLGDDYRIRLEQLPETSYIKSIRMGDVNVLDSGFRLEQPPEKPIEIVISPNAGAIRGIVVNERGLPFSGGTVVLTPDTPSLRDDLYKVAQTDATGRFRIGGIAPGDYRVFAWEDVEDGAWRDSDFLKGFDARGKPVHIEPGSDLTLEVSTIP